MSAIGTQNEVERYAMARVRENDECIDIYFRASDDKWLAVGPDSDVPQGATFFGSWRCDNNTVRYSTKKC